MRTWEIESISYIGGFGSSIAKTDPRAPYSWYIREKNVILVTGSSFTYKEVSLLMKHFGVFDPKDLNGKTFESEKDYALEALELLLLETLLGRKYVPPTYEEIRNRAISSLAKMEEPDYSDVDGHTVMKAFMDVWPGKDPDEKWFADFCQKIKDISGVILRKADPKTFSVGILGPAEFLELVKEDKVQKVILGPYGDPVTFIK
ncbi:MAG TPA: hypothetical protein PLI45_01245 [Candidatus Woesebacteria bacterium]|nr:hypothetical protein [Candidatus Woesebacteria bacterium]